MKLLPVGRFPKQLSNDTPRWPLLRQTHRYVDEARLKLLERAAYVSDSFSSELDQMLSAALKERMCARNLLCELLDTGYFDEPLLAMYVCNGGTCIVVPAVLCFGFLWLS